MAEWIDGPEFVRWLAVRGHSPGNVDGPGSSAAAKWRNGARVNVYTADRILIALGHHLSELPEEMFYPTRQPEAPARREKRRRVVEARRRGLTYREIQDRFGIAETTARNWVKA